MFRSFASLCFDDLSERLKDPKVISVFLAQFRWHGHHIDSEATCNRIVQLAKIAYHPIRMFGDLERPQTRALVEKAKECWHMIEAAGPRELVDIGPYLNAFEEWRIETVENTIALYKTHIATCLEINNSGDYDNDFKAIKLQEARFGLDYIKNHVSKKEFSDFVEAEGLSALLPKSAPEAPSDKAQILRDHAEVLGAWVKKN